MRFDDVKPIIEEEFEKFKRTDYEIHLKKSKDGNISIKIDGNKITILTGLSLLINKLVSENYMTADEILFAVNNGLDDKEAMKKIIKDKLKSVIEKL